MDSRPAIQAPYPPGDLGLPYVGESLAFVKDPFRFLDQRFRKHGPVFKTRILGRTMVCLIGAEALSAMCDLEAFTRREASPPHVRELFHPDAVPFLAGEQLTRRRRLLLSAFTPEALDHYQPIIERVIERYIDGWLDGKERRGTDELGQLCFTISNALFADGDPDTDDTELAATFQRYMRGLFAVPVRLPITSYGRALRARDTMRKHIARAIDDYQPGSASHVLQHLIDARTGDQTLSRAEVAIESLHFFGAAYFAVQAALCAVIEALHDNPQLLAQARDEARAVAGDGPLGSKVTELTAIHRIGLEVRRYYPLAPTTFGARVTRDVEVCGYRIAAGWNALGVLHSTMRDSAAYDHPDRFDPGRFEGSPPGDDNRFVPHGPGPWNEHAHRCAGEPLATRMLDTFIALVARRLIWQLPAQDLEREMAGLSPLPRDGLRVCFAGAPPA